MKPTTQSYKDGVLTIYRMENTAAAGDMPVDGLVTRHAGIRYENRTVGMSRFWLGKQSDIRLDRLLRCPRLTDVHTEDVVVTEDGQQYRIDQVQWPMEVEPPSMDLSLSVLKARLEPDQQEVTS